MLLAIDTSTAQVGLALYDGNQIHAEMMWTTHRHHTTQLPPAIVDLLARSNIKMESLTALGVAIGPGSFTSLRVGLSLAKGIALARHLPILGIPTLDIIAAAQAPAPYPLIAVIQAGRKRLAVGEYENAEGGWKPRGEIRGATVDELAEQLHGQVLLAGELSAEERTRLVRKKNILLAPPIHSARRPSILADLAWKRLQNNECDDAAALAPIYLHVEGAPISS